MKGSGKAVGEVKQEIGLQLPGQFKGRIEICSSSSLHPFGRFSFVGILAVDGGITFHYGDFCPAAP